LNRNSTDFCFDDNRVIDIVKSIMPSAGALDLSAANAKCVALGDQKAQVLDRGTAKLEGGTVESTMQAPGTCGSSKSSGLEDRPHLCWPR
jgi:dTDP-glucose pyrophosphorylase